MYVWCVCVCVWSYYVCMYGVCVCMWSYYVCMYGVCVSGVIMYVCMVCVFQWCYYRVLDKQELVH